MPTSRDNARSGHQSIGRLSPERRPDPDGPLTRPQTDSDGGEPPTTRLLVSVRSRGEAEAALLGGAEWIDVKEPSRGPLGRPDPTVAEEIARSLPDDVPFSVAMGELLEETIDPARHRWPDRVDYAKAGLAGATHETDWSAGWHRIRATLPLRCQTVAVYYADELHARSPDWKAVVAAAQTWGATGILIDTYNKEQGTLFHHLDAVTLDRRIRHAQQLGLFVALAGSIPLELVPRAATLHPDLIAVRGAACQGGRTGTVTTTRVRAIRQAIHEYSADWRKE